MNCEGLTQHPREVVALLLHPSFAEIRQRLMRELGHIVNHSAIEQVSSATGISVEDLRMAFHRFVQTPDAFDFEQYSEVLVVLCSNPALQEPLLEFVNKLGEVDLVLITEIARDDNLDPIKLQRAIGDICLDRSRQDQASTNHVAV